MSHFFRFLRALVHGDRNPVLKVKICGQNRTDLELILADILDSDRVKGHERARNWC